MTRLRKSGEVRRDICCSSCTSLPVLTYLFNILDLDLHPELIFFQQVISPEL